MVIISFELLNWQEYSKTAYFKVVGSGLEIHEIRIKIEDGIAIFQTSDCSCKFGSHWGQTKENIKNGKICRHIIECLNFLDSQAWISGRENLNLTNNGKIQ